MTMTNEEIVRDYRLAKNPKEQIKILADRNATTQDAIQEVLLDAGMEVPQASARKAAGGRKATWDHDRAGKLLAEGKTDSEIAQEMNVSRSAVISWRNRAGLPCNDARKRRAEAEKKPPEQEPVIASAPPQMPEPPVDEVPAIYRQIENVLAALPENMGEKARWAAGKLAAELFAEYLMARLGLREDGGNAENSGGT